MVGILDYGMGNLLSVWNAVQALGKAAKICRSPDDLKDTESIILPGVGAFRDCMMNLNDRGFLETLHDCALIKGMPILGICLGMQVMARKGFEGGEHAGLGWFDSQVIRIKPSDPSLRIPHIGWNEVEYKRNSVFFTDIPVSPDFYFVHSYYMECNNPNDVEATFNYGGTFTAAIRKNNIFATQFHPEKSQDYGLKVLENFLKWNP